MAIISPAQFREHYPSLSGTGEDALLSTLIARADALMAVFCGWPKTAAGLYTLESATYTLYLLPRFDDRRVLDLPHPAVTAITSLHVDPAWADLSEPYGASSEVASSSYLLDANSSQLWLGTYASARFSALHPRVNRVVCVAGFPSAPNAPPNVVALVATAVRHLLDLRRAPTQGGVTGVEVDHDGLLPDSVRAGLAPYIVWASRVG